MLCGGWAWESQNRLLVLVQWAGNYLTRNRGARLITERRRRMPSRIVDLPMMRSRQGQVIVAMAG